jgi:hypothetical protein
MISSKVLEVDKSVDVYDEVVGNPSTNSTGCMNFLNLRCWLRSSMKK